MIRITRADGERRLRRFDELEPAIHAEIEASCLMMPSRLVAGCGDGQRPELPPELHDRAADNWWPLVAIADACGREFRRRAREAALALSGV